VPAESEPNDSAATAIDLAGGWRLVRSVPDFYGTFDDPRDRDVFSIHYDAGTFVRLSTTGVGTKRFYDPQGHVLLGHDGTADDDAPFESTVVIPESGTYFLEVGPGIDDPNPTDTYGIHLYSTSPQRPPSGVQTFDYYRVSLAAGQHLTAFARPVTPRAPVNRSGSQSDEQFTSRIRLESATGAVLASPRVNDPAIRSFVAPASGTYFIRVEGSPFVEYALVLTKDVAADIEPNETRPTAGAPVGDRVLVGALGGEDREDWSAFTAPPGTLATVIASANEADGQAQPLKLALEVFDLGGGRPVSYQVWDGDGRTARASFIVPFGAAFSVHVVAVDGGGTYTLRVASTSLVTARLAFHNNSRNDGNDPAANALDDHAVAAGIRPVREGEPLTWASITNDDRGITGLMLDVQGLPAGAGPGPADVELRAYDRGTWVPVTPSAVALRRGAGTGQTDRVSIVLPDGSVRNTWLKVTLRATPATGLSTPDVFYLGNLAGHTNPASAPVRRAPTVTAADVARTRSRFATDDAASLASCDFDRDGVVTANDVLAARRNLGRSLPVVAGPGGFFIPAATDPGAVPPQRPAGVAPLPKRSVWSSIQPDR
jgi:hypothetical protein